MWYIINYIAAGLAATANGQITESHGEISTHLVTAIFEHAGQDDLNNDGVTTAADLIAIARRQKATPTSSVTATPSQTPTATSTASMTPTASATSTATAISLRSAAKARGITIGAAAQSWLLSDPRYAQALQGFGSATFEYELNPNIVNRTRGLRLDFTGADIIANFAQENGMTMTGHPLLWWEQLPDWINQLAPNEFQNVVSDQVRQIVRHFHTNFPGVITQWVVLNEAMGDDAVLRPFWQERGGLDFFVEIFNIVREEDPTSELLYNDYGGEGMGSKANAIFSLVEALQERGAPITGVGLEMHWKLSDGESLPAVKRNMERLADINMSLHITELDIRLRLSSAEQDQQAQTDLYHDIVVACLDQVACKSITVWGIDDPHSWVNGFFPGYGRPLLYGEEFIPKQSYLGVLDALNGQ